jgi:Cu/Ag efflux pump CusA
MAAYLGGGSFSLASLFGLLTVLGITVRNSVTMIGHYQRLEAQDGSEFGSELIVRGARERVAPILITTLTTAAAALPFAIFGGVPGQEMIHPMAVVILGGLITSSVVNLFVLPALYLDYGASREADLRMVRVAAGAQD